MSSTMRVLTPHPNVLGFYDGRLAGVPRLYPEENWFDDGAFGLGICSYAIVDGDEALVYDTHISVDHARRIRAELERRGVRRIVVVLSHWHADHVAGTAAFDDCVIIANHLTRDLLARHAAEFEKGPPPIVPVVMPTRVFDGSMRVRVGRIDVELRHADIHSSDGTVLLLSDGRLMLAGDTLEDPITYVVEPERLVIHLDGLREMQNWSVDRILPNHGAPEAIAEGGYGPSLIAATIRYVEHLLTHNPARASSLRDLMADDLAQGSIVYEPAYEQVHARNVKAVRALPERAAAV